MEIKLRNIFIFCMFFVTLYCGSVGAETLNTEKLLCDDIVKMQEVLIQKGYFHLLDMKNENGVVQQLWSGGRSMVITAVKDNKLCLLSTADEVTFNPITLQKIIEVYKKSQKEL